MQRNISLSTFLPCALACAYGLVAASMLSAATMTPFSSFGGGDGWLAPGEGGTAYLGTANNERGLAFGNGHLYLVSHANVSGNSANVRILDATTGADLGGLSSTGITGGTFAVNAAGFGNDGALYVSNLTTNSTSSPFKVYRWATEGSAPTVAYSGNGGLAASRVGDDFTALGSGSSTLLAAGYGSGFNGYAIIDPVAPTATQEAFGTTPPNNGDFRLGITFVDATHVIGTAGSSLYRYTSYSGGTGTLIASPTIPDPAGATADRLLSYTTIGGIPILAVQSIGDSHVTIYDATNPGAPIYIASGNNTSGTLTANANGTGELAWGNPILNGDGSVSRVLYTMSTNQGIQAFLVSVPEPATMSLGIIAVVAGAVVRRRRDG